MVRKANVGESSSGDFKMPHGSPKAETGATGYGDGRPSYKGHGSPLMSTYKSSASNEKGAPGTSQSPNKAVGHGSKTSYPKKKLQSFGTGRGGLTSPPGGMSPKAC